MPQDSLLSVVPRDAQQQAARLVQEAFAAAFRLSVEASAEQRQPALQKLSGHLLAWSNMATREEGVARRALLLTGLDQWGLAFSQAFGPGGLDGLSELVGLLRDGIDISEEAACQRWFEEVQSQEDTAFDFKVLLRRELHLALWHAMVASEEREEADVVLRHLGGMMLALVEQMPQHGWRLIADALASIQMRCLSQGIALEGIGQEATQTLFASLAAALPEAERERIMQQSSEAVRAWQAARRGPQH
ncbi:hypothetical protein GCM10025770_02290 [Viridibacterium curvum]|uniref:Uncharacterized protein n=2 Tax=Viridibacterium curvum TaxID=1101404 RepID=A0ABP9QB83_9RHOO